MLLLKFIYIRSTLQLYKWVATPTLITETMLNEIKLELALKYNSYLH